MNEQYGIQKIHNTMQYNQNSFMGICIHEQIDSVLLQGRIW